jgi:hypothetical protein
MFVNAASMTAHALCTFANRRLTDRSSLFPCFINKVSTTADNQLRLFIYGHFLRSGLLLPLHYKCSVLPLNYPSKDEAGFEPAVRGHSAAATTAYG